MSELLWQLLLRSALASMVAVGGATAVIPFVHAEVVTQMHWMDDRTFTGLIAISQFMPGPNMLLLPLVGWYVAGAVGAAVALFAFMIPPGLLVFAVGRALRHHGENPTIAALRSAVRPVSAGLLIASGIILTRATGASATAIGVSAAIVAAALYRPRINPLWWLSLAGLTGLLVHR